MLHTRSSKYNGLIRCVKHFELYVLTKCFVTHPILYVLQCLINHNIFQVGTCFLFVLDFSHHVFEFDMISSFNACIGVQCKYYTLIYIYYELYSGNQGMNNFFT